MVILVLYAIVFNSNDDLALYAIVFISNDDLDHYPPILL